MKTIEIEKELNLKGAIDLLPVSMKENFVYEQEADGIRCVGPFYIHGRYTTINEVRDFQDVFEFDVFAANEKLDGEPFEIAYQGYDYSLQNGVTLILHFNVFGIKEDKEEDVFAFDIPYHDEVEENTQEPVSNEDYEAWHEDTFNDNPVLTQEVKQEEDIEQEEVTDTVEEVKAEDVADVSMIEELFEEKDNVITSYSFVVVKKADTYESIANRYQVDVETLKEVNAHKELHEKALIVLPYGK